MTKAKVFRNNRSQAVRLPKEFRFGVGQVFVRRVGRDLVLSAQPVDWGEFLESTRVASSEFMRVGQTASQGLCRQDVPLDRWGLPRG